jgi:hypothetical protein
MGPTRRNKVRTIGDCLKGPKVQQKLMARQRQLELGKNLLGTKKKRETNDLNLCGRTQQISFCFRDHIGSLKTSSLSYNDVRQSGAQAQVPIRTP